MSTVGKRFARGHWYAKNSRQGFLHRFLMGLPKGDGYKVDHRNGDGLDCRRENMRVATHAQNMQNRKVQSNNTSGFRGVTWNQGKWAAVIKVLGRNVQLGRFADPKEAALAFDAKACEVRGEFARTNF